MASAAPSKRMVSSVFITLATPYRGTVTQQQQPTLKAHSSSVLDNHQAAVQICPTDTISKATQKKDNNLSSETNGIRPKGNDQTVTVASAQASDPQNPRVKPGPIRAKLPENKKHHNRDFFPSPPPPPHPVQSSRVGTALSEETALPRPPSAQEPPLSPLTPGQQPVYSREVETSPPSSGLSKNTLLEKTHKPSQDASEESKEICGFCRKPVILSEPAIEALNRTYHEACFQCRSCHIPLACKQYYNKAGIPLCEDCYQASLELCWACGEVIKDQVIRALERAYHPTCFTCTTCKQLIGEQRFAQGEVGEVYCLQDYYRKYAPKCNACNQLIIPKEDGTDSYTVECLGHSYHENCYRCEVCFLQLTPEPNEHGCYPLDGKMLCKSCHLSLVSAQHEQ